MINIPGIISIILFYLMILGVGIWAAKKQPKGADDSEEVMLAGRSIGIFVGIFTMTGENCGICIIDSIIFSGTGENCRICIISIIIIIFTMTGENCRI